MAQKLSRRRSRAQELIDNTPNSAKMECMKILPRAIESRLRQALDRQKSVLLLGPRQTGKTTLLEPLQPDLMLNFLRPEVRQRYERSPQLLSAELETLTGHSHGRRPLVALDEVQRVPELVNVAQDAIDRRLARFILTGSSARKLRRGAAVNLLPGRLVPLRLDPLSLAERVPPTLEEALVYGSLPSIALAAAIALRAKRTCAHTRRCIWKRKCGLRRWCVTLEHSRVFCNWLRWNRVASAIFAESPRNSACLTPLWPATTKSWRIA